MLEDGYKTITDLDLWGWLATHTPDKETGFMFSDHENVSKISNSMKVGHSGASFGLTMRHMEVIAKGGWEDYVDRLWKRQ